MIKHSNVLQCGMMALLLLIQGCASTESSPREPSVTYEQLQKGHVTGRLGEQLGTVVKVSGTVRKIEGNAKKGTNDRLVLEIDRVNDKKLPKTQTLDLAFDSSFDGNEFKIPDADARVDFLGYERIYSSGTPDVNADVLASTKGQKELEWDWKDQ